MWIFIIWYYLWKYLWYPSWLGFHSSATTGLIIISLVVLICLVFLISFGGGAECLFSSSIFVGLWSFRIHSVMSSPISLIFFYAFFNNTNDHEQLLSDNLYTMIYSCELSHFFECYACRFLPSLWFFSLIFSILINNLFLISSNLFLTAYA